MDRLLGRSALPLLLLACNPAGKGRIDGTTQPGGVCDISAATLHANPSVPATVDWQVGGVPFDEARFRMRAVEVTAPGGASLQASAGLSVLDASGSPVQALTPGSGPTTLLVRGDAHGSGSLVVGPPAACSSQPVTLEFTVRPAVDLVGKPLVGDPGFTLAQTFLTTEAVSLGLDGRDHPDREGLEFDAWIVPHRTPAEWAADPTLADAADGPVPGTVGVGTRAEQAQALWTSDLSVPDGQTWTSYDVVLDFGRDGQLDPGDLVDGLEHPGFTVVRDLASAGPHAVLSGEHSTGFWTTMRVYAPDAALTDAPLVVISHGNGHDYTWYDYLGQHLASWGYVVISHRNDTEPGPVSAAGTTLENTDVFLRDVDTLGLPVTVDPNRIAWIGHSRGGEGVVLAYNALVQGAANVTEYGAADIVSLHSIAPTLFEDPDAADPHDVPYHLLAGSADGDVTGGVDTGLTQYFRIFLRGTGPHSVTYVQGADHNDFNCCGPEDGNWPTVQGNPPLVGRERAQDITRSYLLALLERDMNGAEGLGAFHGANPEIFAPPATDGVVVTQAMAPAGGALVIDDFQTNPDDDRSAIGGAVSTTLPAFGEGGMDDNNFRLNWNPSDPANGMTWSHNDPDPDRAMIVEWADGDDGLVEWEIPAAHRDWSTSGTLSLRACQTTRHAAIAALNGPLSFTVALVDGAGNEAAHDLGAWGRIPPPTARAGLGDGTGWVNEFQTVQIPLQDFTAGPTRVDLTDISAIRLRFGAAWGTTAGRVGLDDLEVLPR